MAFKVHKPESFHLEKPLIDRMEAICSREGISLNKLTVQYIEYALDHMEPSEKKPEE